MKISKYYSNKEIILRIVWAFSYLLVFKYTPRLMYNWRNFILRIFGAKIGKQTNIYPSAIIYFPWKFEVGNFSSIGEWALVYNLGKVRIGDRSTVSHRAHLCAGTHDYNDPSLPLLKSPIEIEDQAWICADAFIGPGITVHENAIVGACSVVVKDVSRGEIVAGNPAMPIGKRNLQ